MLALCRRDGPEMQRIEQSSVEEIGPHWPVKEPQERRHASKRDISSHTELQAPKGTSSDYQRNEDRDACCKANGTTPGRSAIFLIAWRSPREEADDKQDGNRAGAGEDGAT